jgi:hypothetical protein
VRKWEMSSVDGAAGGFKGTRREAVAKARELTNRSGRKVWTQPKGTVTKVTGKGTPR